MFAWILNNLTTIIVVLVLVLIIGAAVFSVVRDRKSGSCKCTGNCASCKMGCSCDKK